MKRGINFFTTCGLNPFSGYGKLEIGLLRGLVAAGVKVTPFGPLSDEALSPGVLSPRLVKKLSASNKLHSATLVTALPQKLEQWFSRRGETYLYTMSESTQVSPEWVEMINERCAAVLVPCPALVGIYMQSGVKVPVHDVGCGVDYHIPPAPGKKPERGEFIFLSYSYGDMRKGAHKAIQAFKLAFGDKPNFKLWIKARKVKDTWLAGCKDDQIRIIEGHLSEKQWYKLLRRVDCFVFPSYAEGYGLPPREATLAGVPTIATAWLGLWDVACWGLPVSVKRFLPANFDYWEANAEGSLWADPDDDYLIEQMRWVAQFPEQAREVALRGREYLLKNCTWQQTAKRMINAQDNVLAS